jgi:hypothetical protein
VKKRKVWLRTVVILAILGLALFGCAAKHAQKAMQTERLLHAAGFQMKLADTPEKLKQVKALQQRKFFLHTHEGKPYYVYADVASCNCIYVGPPEAYQRYVDLRVQQDAAEGQAKAARAEQAAASAVPMNWTVWGTWGPWY